ncbi:MAG: serine/threonine-protein kinase [Acidobacteriota bacterium]
MLNGEHLGPYEVLAKLGEGGMGEVYRARDAKLNRDVAIKILPDALAADPAALARFEREAQAVAALSHPNILAIHDFGREGATAYAVMELLEGETLRARLAQGALSPRKAVDLAVQIADGLAAAHEKGIVHRDLKPENIFVTGEGRAKILDFGVAKRTDAAREAGTSDRAGANLETSLAHTGPGMVMGTVGYMSPEQVRGEAVDHRSDIFAYGAVFYEMLAGRRAFQGATPADTISAILKEDPPELTTATAHIPPSLDRIVRRCLEKNPDERFQSARDVAFALEAMSGSGATSSAVSAAPPIRRWPRRLAFALGALALLGAGVVVGTRLTSAPPSVAFAAKTWDAGWIANARFGPDGQTIVFSAAQTGNMPSVFVLRPGMVAPQSVGPPRTHLLAVSSKGELAVLTDPTPYNPGYSGTLATMTMDTAPRALLEHVRDADWSPDGSQLAVIRDLGSHDQLEYPIGHLLYAPPSGYLSDLRISRDGARVAFTEHQIRFDDRGPVKVVDLAGHVTTLTADYRAEMGLAWSADGQSVWFSASDQGDTAVQPQVVNVAGPPKVRPVLPSAGALVVQDVAASGHVLVVRHDWRSSMRMLLAGAVAERDFSGANQGQGGILSRDGQLLLYSDRSQSAGPNYAVALRRTDGSPSVRLGEGDPWTLSPDAKWALAFVASTGRLVLYPTGPGTPVAVDLGPIEHYTWAQWFPDGTRLLVCGNEPKRAPRCYQQPMGGGPPTPVTPDDVESALIAPDGRTLLLLKTSGAKQVYVIGGTAATDALGIVATDVPKAWSRDGRSVFVQAGIVVPARIERVDLGTGVRTLVRELAPPDRSGLCSVFVDQWLDEGKAYVYEFTYDLSTLFVATGIK